MLYKLVLVISLALIGSVSSEQSIESYRKVYEQLIGDTSTAETYNPEDAVGIMDSYLRVLPDDFGEKPREIQNYVIAMFHATLVLDSNCDKGYFDKMQSLADEAPVNLEVATKHIRYFERKQSEHCVSLMVDLVRKKLADEKLESKIEPLMRVLRDANLVSLPDMNIRQDARSSDYIEPLYKYLDNIEGETPLTKRVKKHPLRLQLEFGERINQPCFLYLGAMEGAKRICLEFGPHNKDLMSKLPENIKEKFGKASACKALIDLYTNEDIMLDMYKLFEQSIPAQPAKKSYLFGLIKPQN